MKTKDLVYQGKDNGLLCYRIYDSVSMYAYYRPKKIKGGYLCCISGGMPIRKGVVLTEKMQEKLDAYDDEFIDNESDAYVVVKKDGNGDIHLGFAKEYGY